jgi:hypothetical protein
MKGVLLSVLLLVSAALAASALTKEDLIIVASSSQRILQTPTDVRATVTPNVSKAFPAFNITLSAAKLPPGVQLQTPAVQTFNGKATVEFPAVFTWKATSQTDTTYDLSAAFEVLSWDDRVALSLDPLPEKTDKKAVKIAGTTDSAALCAEHEYKGEFSKPENCQVRIFVNDKELGFATRAGTFEFDYELVAGTNRLAVKAVDPGGNSEETVRTVEYSPSLGTLASEKPLEYIALPLLLIVLAGFAVYWTFIRKARGEVKALGAAELEKARTLFKQSALDWGTLTFTGGSDKAQKSYEAALNAFADILRLDDEWKESTTRKAAEFKERPEALKTADFSSEISAREGIPALAKQARLPPSFFLVPLNKALVQEIEKRAKA